jgi:hypothetical protein
VRRCVKDVCVINRSFGIVSLPMKMPRKMTDTSRYDRRTGQSLLRIRHPHSIRYQSTNMPLDSIRWSCARRTPHNLEPTLQKSRSSSYPDWTGAHIPQDQFAGAWRRWIASLTRETSRACGCSRLSAWKRTADARKWWDVDTETLDATFIYRANQRPLRRKRRFIDGAEKVSGILYLRRTGSEDERSHQDALSSVKGIGT